MLYMKQINVLSAPRTCYQIQHEQELGSNNLCDTWIIGNRLQK